MTLHWEKGRDRERGVQYENYVIASRALIHYNVRILMRDERRKEERSKRSNKNKAEQHSTPKAVTFPKKNELPQVGSTRTHDTLFSRQSALPLRQFTGPKSHIS